MSITPSGGWGDPSRKAEAESDSSPSVRDRAGKATYLQAPSMSRRLYLACKICDTGTLGPKKMFRMSGPVVAIGFILLVPSILGVVSSALILLGVNVFAGADPNTNTSESVLPIQSEFDATFRKSCAASLKQRTYGGGYRITQQVAQQICECSLSTFKETGSKTIANETCAQKLVDGTLEQPNQNVDAFYASGAMHHPSPDSPNAMLFARVIGSGFAVALGIASFVGGLLGWLLVMRKRVLQCDVCGAVVNAS